MSDDLVKMARLAQHDERMSTGALYGDLADRIEELEAKLAYALVALQQALDSLSFAAHELAAQAHIPEEDSEMLWDRISLVTATIAKMEGEQP